MLNELADFFPEPDGDPIMILVISGLVREEYPWLSEILTESYRELKHASRKEAEMIGHRLHRVMKEMLHGRLGESLMRKGSKENFVLAMELPHMIERIIDRSINMRRNSSAPEEGDDNLEDLREE
jgi:hypothetical protein